MLRFFSVFHSEGRICDRRAASNCKLYTQARPNRYLLPNRPRRFTAADILADGCPHGHEQHYNYESPVQLDRSKLAAAGRSTPAVVAGRSMAVVVGFHILGIAGDIDSHNPGFAALRMGCPRCPIRIHHLIHTP